jgi:two-component system, response regulator FlrC
MIILLAEDDPRLREALTDSLEIQGHQVLQAANGHEAWLMLEKQKPDLVLSDINMPGMSGLVLLERVRANQQWLPMVLMTAYGDVSQAVQAMQRGANDYLMKPFDLSELENLLKTFDPGQTTMRPSGEEPVCVSPSARQLFQLAERLAATDTTVLISGESGTGKEVLARYIHQKSDRVDGPFVAINCAAIPENMLEAILFGYEKGAYTGAYTASAGKFEQAQHGTLLLDEISEMDPGLQAKLLRVLQERQVERLGGKRPLDLDVRIIATTNRDLAEHVADGHFREDLYYRLSVFPLQWLPLRQRREDILPLAKRLLAHHATKMKRRIPNIMPDAERMLLQHDWPGNVRELDNCMQRALIMQAGSQVFASDLVMTAVPRHRTVTADNRLIALSGQTEGENLAEDDGALGTDLRHREVELIIQALREEPSRKEAAERLGISPRTLRYKMARLRDEGFDVESRLRVS